MQCYTIWSQKSQSTAKSYKTINPDVKTFCTFSSCSPAHTGFGDDDAIYDQPFMMIPQYEALWYYEHTYIHACMKRFKIFDEIHFSGFPCSSMQRTSRQTSKRQDLLWPSLSCRLVIIIIESSSSASASDENPLLINMFGTMLYHYPHHNLNFHNICLFIWPGKDQRVNFQKCFRRNHFWQSFWLLFLLFLFSQSCSADKNWDYLATPSDEILRWTISAPVELQD